MVFYIDAVHYAYDSNGNKLYIESVRGTFDLNERASKVYTKQAIIDYINEGNSVKTKYYRNYQWRIGEDVRVIDNQYLRTDANDIKSDNLENLPEY